MEVLRIWLLKHGVEYIAYFVLIIVTLRTVKLMIEHAVKTQFQSMQYRYRIRRNKTYKEVKQKQYDHPLLKHIYFLIKTTSKEKSATDILSFVIITSMLFIFSLVVSVLLFGDVIFSIFISLLVAIIPYMGLHLRLRNIRSKVGDEFLNVVQTLAQNYNAAQYDMYTALAQTAKVIQDHQLKRVFMNLISELQISRNEREIRLAIDLFVYSAGSNWSKRLGNVILKAYLNDENVINTLLTLIKQIEETEEMLEEEKSHALDAVWNGYLTVPLFFASLILGYYVSGAQDWFHLQFGNYWTRFLVVVSGVLVFFSVYISLILKKPKNDI